MNTVDALKNLYKTLAGKDYAGDPNPTDAEMIDAIAKDASSGGSGGGGSIIREIEVVDDALNYPYRLKDISTRADFEALITESDDGILHTFNTPMIFVKKSESGRIIPLTGITMAVAPYSQGDVMGGWQLFYPDVAWGDDEPRAYAGSCYVMDVDGEPRLYTSHP